METKGTMNNNLKVELEDKIKKYYEEIRYLDIVFQAYHSMNFDKRWEDLYKLSPAYFTVVKKSLFYYFIISLSKLFEGRNRSDFNLNSFISKLKDTYEKYECNIPKVIIDLEEHVKNNEKLIKNLMTWRDRSIAHYDKKYFLEASSLSNDAKIGYDELEEVINKTLELIGKLDYEVCKEATFLKFINDDDYKYLLGFIGRAKKI